MHCRFHGANIFYKASFRENFPDFRSEFGGATLRKIRGDLASCKVLAVFFTLLLRPLPAKTSGKIRTVNRQGCIIAFYRSIRVFLRTANLTVKRNQIYSRRVLASDLFVKCI